MKVEGREQQETVAWEREWTWQSN